MAAHPTNRLAVPAPTPPKAVLNRFRDGLVIPAHPLALTKDGKLDETSQRALTRYYLAAGAGGLAVGVHTTQFEIRDDEYGLLKPVLELAAETARQADSANARTDDTVLIAGVCGDTKQAVAEAALARDLGYHAGLLSLAALNDATEDALIEHAKRIAEELPVVGFYLQPAVGGRRLGYSFWRRFADIDGVIGIKVAPFNRYQTQDVLRAVVDSGRQAPGRGSDHADDEITLYTGNDDHIIFDLAGTWSFETDDDTRQSESVHFSGGLLGHWACWTRPAVSHLARCRAARFSGVIDAGLQVLAGQVTECNAALFDVANNFAGCIAGIHHVLASQGIMQNVRCLDPDECVSPGQIDLIEGIRTHYPHLTDDAWVAEHVDDWRR